VTGYYFQPLHNLPLDEITKDQIQTRIDHIAIQSGNMAARNCCTALRVFFKWAFKNDKLPEHHRDPMTNVQPPKLNEPRERVLTNDEIQLICKTCEVWEAEAIHRQHIGRKGLRGGRPTTVDLPRAVMLLFLTGCRAQEIGDLQWPEVDLDN